MKNIILIICLFLFAFVLNAQNKNINLNESICYCIGNTPISTIKLDNNWDILLTLKEPKTLKQLDSLKIRYTFSQLKLLEQWNVIQRIEDDHYQTIIKIFDSTSTQDLRAYSEKLASNMVEVIKPNILELKNQLKIIDRDKNIYSILFSYIIDGMVWNYLEKENLIDKRETNTEHPFWNGEFWTLNSKRNFSCGTNTISDKGHSIKVNWSEKAIPKMIPFVTRWDLLGKIIDDFINKGKLQDQEAFDAFNKFNFFDSSGNFTVPIIVEKDDNVIFTISKGISAKIIDFIMSEIDLNYLNRNYNFKNNSQAIIILYHEMIWDILKILEEENIIEKPIAFQDPNKTEPKDIGDLLILVKPNNELKK